MADAKNSSPENFKGWLYKWTNYIKGYQRRWFVLSNGLLSYYRNQAEMAHTCRGTINLAGAYIDTEDSCNFVISSGAQTFHLKASSEVERQRWVTALELAKAKAIQMMEADSDDDAEGIPTEVDRTEFQGTLRILTSKLDDLNTCNDLIAKHGAALQRSLGELDSVQDPVEASAKLKGINERTTLFRITSNAMINACADYLELAQTQGRKWQKSLQYERDQRLRLEETIETLAKQHNVLEQACRTVKKKGDTASQDHSEDEDNEFFDAVEDSAFTKTLTLPAIKTHRRNDSGASAASSEGQDRDQGEYGSSDEDMMPEQREAVVLVNKGDKALMTAGQHSDHQIKRHPKKPGRERRKTIPPRPNHSLNLWSIIKNCIGKELSKIPMPVNFNEPLSYIQRFTETSGNCYVLNNASSCDSTLEELAHVAAFSITAYTPTAFRTTKPFNPLLGETFEYDRMDDLGWRSFAEQVSHHPPAAAIHVESKDWKLWSDITITSKFRGKYLQVFPQGITHIQFKKSGSHYTYRKVTSTVHNIIVGKLWVDQSGECEIYNHTTGEKCRMNFKPYSYFSGDTPRKVTGVILDKAGQARFILSGTWDKKMECARVQHISNEKSGKGKPVYQTGTPKLLWHQKPLPPSAELMYNLSELAITLNEPDPAVAPTDSRNRPDQRLMENGFWDEANQEKLRLEEKQRTKRRKQEADSMALAEQGQHVDSYKPMWFDRKMDELTKTMAYRFNDKYWKCKDKQTWDECPDIF